MLGHHHTVVLVQIKHSFFWLKVCKQKDNRKGGWFRVLTLFQHFQMHMRIRLRSHSSRWLSCCFMSANLKYSTHPMINWRSWNFLSSYPQPLLRLVSAFKRAFILVTLWGGAPRDGKRLYLRKRSYPEISFHAHNRQCFFSGNLQVELGFDKFNDALLRPFSSPFTLTENHTAHNGQKDGPDVRVPYPTHWVWYCSTRDLEDRLEEFPACFPRTCDRQLRLLAYIYG